MIRYIMHHHINDPDNTGGCQCVLIRYILEMLETKYFDEMITWIKCPMFLAPKVTEI